MRGFTAPISTSFRAIWPRNGSKGLSENCTRFRSRQPLTIWRSCGTGAGPVGSSDAAIPSETITLTGSKTIFTLMTTSTIIRITKTAKELDVSVAFDPPNPERKHADTIDGMLALIAVSAIKDAMENAKHHNRNSPPGNN